MSDYLRDRAKPGVRLRLKAPLGAFYLHKVTRPLILVAGGTGLAAFLGMLDEMAARHEDEVALARAEASAQREARRTAEAALETARARLAEALSSRRGAKEIAAAVADPIRSSHAQVASLVAETVRRAERCARALTVAFGLAAAAGCSLWAVAASVPDLPPLPLV
jgi:ferredoxin-NADP reductase